MKKIVTILLMALAVTSGVFAKKAKKGAAPAIVITIPEGKQLFVAVWYYAAGYCRDNGWVDFDLVENDVQDDSYTVSGYGIYSGANALGGLQRQSYTVDIKAVDGHLVVNTRDFNSVGCNERGTPLSDSKPFIVGGLKKSLC